VKVCIFGSTSNLGLGLGSILVQGGCPVVMAHRNTLDVIAPLGDDTTFTRSNPYHTFLPFFFHLETVNDVKPIILIFLTGIR
jgi:hypothetical protein